jgi:hypothetical protein
MLSVVLRSHLHAAVHQRVAHCLLHVACCLLPVACCLLPVACSALRYAPDPAALNRSVCGCCEHSACRARWRWAGLCIGPLANDNAVFQTASECCAVSFNDVVAWLQGGLFFLKITGPSAPAAPHSLGAVPVPVPSRLLNHGTTGAVGKCDALRCHRRLTDLVIEFCNSTLNK